MTVTELRKELEQLESDGKGSRLVVIDVPDEGERDYQEVSTVRTFAADARSAGDFDVGQELVVIE